MRTVGPFAHDEEVSILFKNCLRESKRQDLPAYSPDPTDRPGSQEPLGGEGSTIEPPLLSPKVCRRGELQLEESQDSKARFPTRGVRVSFRTQPPAQRPAPKHKIPRNYSQCEFRNVDKGSILIVSSLIPEM